MTIKTREAQQRLATYRTMTLEQLQAETYRLAVSIEESERGYTIDLQKTMHHHLAMAAMLECGLGAGDTAQQHARRTLTIDHHMSEAGRFERLSYGMAARGDGVMA